MGRCDNARIETRVFRRADGLFLFLALPHASHADLYATADPKFCIEIRVTQSLPHYSHLAECEQVILGVEIGEQARDPAHLILRVRTKTGAEVIRADRPKRACTAPRSMSTLPVGARSI